MCAHMPKKDHVGYRRPGHLSDEYKHCVVRTREGKIIKNNFVPLRTGAEEPTAQKTLDAMEAFAYGSLRYWMLLLNGVGAIAHLVGVLLTQIRGRSELRLRLYKTMPFNSGNETHPVLSREVVRDGAVYPVSILSAFFGLSLMFHVVVALILTLQITVPRVKLFGVYMRFLYKNVGPQRWLEYFFSASLMIFIMTVLLGLRDVHVLTLVVAMMATTILFGWLTEVHSMDYIENDAKPYTLWRWKLTRRWTPGSWRSRLQIHVLGYVPYAVMWQVIFAAFQDNIQIVSDSLPDFVHVAVIGSFIAFTGFGFVQLSLQIFPYGPSLYWLGEVSYVVLSFTAKAQLGFVILEQALVEGGLYDGQLSLNKNS